MKQTLLRPHVWLGLLGTCLVAWGGANDEFSLSAVGWPDPVATWFGSLAPLPLDRIMIVAGAVALTYAWWQVRPARGREPVHAGLTLLIWSLPLWLAPPVLSPDVVLYADIGYELEQGLSPYATGLGSSGGPYAGQIDPLWAGSGVAYPPLAVVIMGLMAKLTGFHPYWGYIAMRLPVALAVAAMLWLVPQIAAAVGQHRRRAMWMGVLNPLLVLHLIGGGHNDAPMIAMALFAIWLVAWKPTWWMSLLAAPVAVGVAMALKQQGGLAVVAVAGLPLVLSRRGHFVRCHPGLVPGSPDAVRCQPTDHDPPPSHPGLVPGSPDEVRSQPNTVPWPDRLRHTLLPLAWRTAVATTVTVTSFIGICFATGLGLGWINWLDLMGKANTPAPLAMLAKLGTLLVGLAGGDGQGFATAAGLFSTGVLAAAVMWIVVHYADRPLEAVAWGSLVVAIGGQALHPWYLPWSLALLGLVPLTQTQRRWVYGLALAFTIWNAIQTVIWHGQY
ncbi:MAG: polyprenol phosphomannose-dependent alpha 1,6 mannosyltransferase MptB [Propionibacteriaceae bacterium]|nr:polyprenol phosphomannose-dependent alpha 1,6 mannosyltransferase MptB [Propionibacteriaceae bacterium]